MNIHLKYYISSHRMRNQNAPIMTAIPSTVIEISRSKFQSAKSILKKKKYKLSKYKFFQPCCGFFLQGSVKETAIANSFVAIASMVIFAVGIAEYIPSFKDESIDIVIRCLKPVFWLAYYSYWTIDIYLSYFLHEAASQRDLKLCRKWLKIQKICYPASFAFFLCQSAFIGWYNVILPPMFVVTFIYKVYTFWVVSSFIIELDNYGSFNEPLAKLTDQDLEDFVKGFGDDRISSPPPETRPYDQQFEINMDYINDKSEWTKIGEGEFGVVYKVLMRKLAGNDNDNDSDVSPTLVALKTINPDITDALRFKTLLKELKIRIYIGHHENIVNLLGACTKDIRERKLDIVVELCPFGNLESFLSARKGLFINQVDVEGNIHYYRQNYSTVDGSLPSLPTLECVQTTDLIRWSRHIACGMEYLSSKKVIHGDLAARNVLLTGEKIAKISDFGLSHRMYSYQNYVQSKQKLVPWRWMPPESLGPRLLFSLESDLWSFGVTLWELFSLGDAPYGLLEYSETFKNELKNGYRLQRPPFAPLQIYQLMLDCMKLEPKERLTFDAANVKLEKILNEFHTKELSNNLRLRGSTAIPTDSPYVQNEPSEQSPVFTSYK